MAKIKKKGTSGQAKNFITRTQAVRKLQISLPDFRRLCIFKGIYPREPRNKKKASKSSTPSTTFYYTKDIQYLLHEPLLAKFRDHKALSKKIARALGRGEVRDAARLEKNNAPKLSLDHIIKERYPTFHDALRDLDDALSMLFLFANLPSTATVPPKTIALCQRLCQEFQHYLITTHSLRKSFLSIKGIYYQATVQGQDILWLVPYRFVQRVTGDVDFRIMGTFVEFYTTLLGFVNFRLYTSVGLVYPPKFNVGSDESGGELGAFTLEGRGVGGSTTSVVQSDMSSSTDVAPIDMTAIRDDPNAAIAEEDSDPGKLFDDVVSDSIDKFETPAVPDADILPQPQQSSTEAGSLFANLTFYLSRETPRQPLEFLLRAFGCKRIGWDAVLGDGAFTYDESDPNVTHQIVDRPPIPLPAMDGGEIQESSEATSITKTGHRYPGRTYIQPQWVWDCVNEGKLLRPDIYAPGATLPPHLSPWVKPMKGTYDPTLSLAEQEREGEADAASELESEEGEEEEVEDTKTGKSDTGKLLKRQNSEVETGEGMDVADTEDESESDAEEESALSSDGEGWDGFGDIEESEDEHETAKDAHQRELEAEAAGLPFSTGSIQEMSSVKNDPKSEARKKAAKKRREEEEELERQKMMMPRKKRKILEKMLYSNRKKEEEAELLRKKRRKIEKNKA